MKLPKSNTQPERETTAMRATPILRALVAAICLSVFGLVGVPGAPVVTPAAAEGVTEERQTVRVKYIHWDDYSRKSRRRHTIDQIRWEDRTDTDTGITKRVRVGRMFHNGIEWECQQQDAGDWLCEPKKTPAQGSGGITPAYKYCYIDNSPVKVCEVSVQPGTRPNGEVFGVISDMAGRDMITPCVQRFFVDTGGEYYQCYAANGHVAVTNEGTNGYHRTATLFTATSNETLFCSEATLGSDAWICAKMNPWEVGGYTDGTGTGLTVYWEEPECTLLPVPCVVRSNTARYNSEPSAPYESGNVVVGKVYDHTFQVSGGVGYYVHATPRLDTRYKFNAGEEMCTANAVFVG